MTDRGLGGAVTADIAARALIAAARQMNVPPLSVFEPKVGRGGARLLAAIWLGRLTSKAAAARICGVAHGNQLAPSQWAKAAVTRADVAAVEAALDGSAPRIASPRRVEAKPALAAHPPLPERPAKRPPATTDGRAAALYLAAPPNDPPVIQPSPARGSRTAGKPMAVSAAATGARSQELAIREGEFVRRKRAAGTPWAHIAQQLVVPVIDLRRRHDPEFAEP